MKMLTILRMKNGEPELNLADPKGIPGYTGKPVTPVKNYALAGQLRLASGEWGVYILSATESDFAQLRELEHLYEIITIQGVGRTYQDGSMDTPLPANIRNRLNAWIAENTTWEQIPAGRTARQVVVDLFRRFNQYFDLSKIEIMNYEGTTRGDAGSGK